MNKVMLIGRLGADPESKVSVAGKNAVHIRLATTRKWNDRVTGQKMEQTEWHRIVFFNRLAEIAREFLIKGQQIYVEGRIHTNKWKGDDGADKFSTKIIGEEMLMLGSKETGVRTEKHLSDVTKGFNIRSHDDHEIDDIPF